MTAVAAAATSPATYLSPTWQTRVDPPCFRGSIRCISETGGSGGRGGKVKGEKGKVWKEMEKSRMAREREKAKESREEMNRKIASRKAISVVLRREAAMAVLDRKKTQQRGTNSRKLLPSTVLEALHDRIAALRWESALKVFDLLRDQLWYRPNSGLYIKLIVMLGKCRQPDRAQALFDSMLVDGCPAGRHASTALLGAYGRSGRLDAAFAVLESMKASMDHASRPDVNTYSVLLMSCLRSADFDRASKLLTEMEAARVRPNAVTYNTLIDSYGRAGRFAEMEATLASMDCAPDTWTMNAVLRAFGAAGNISMMERCYDQFLRGGVDPSISTFNILLDAYGKSGLFDKMAAVMSYMERRDFSWTLVTYNVVIDAFARSGQLDLMEHVFKLMKSDKSKPDRVTLSTLVRAYGHAGRATRIEAVLRLVENSDVALDKGFFECLIDAYAKVGKLAEMRRVPEMMRARGCQPDHRTYRRMLTAYLSRGIDDPRIVEDLRQLC